MASKRYKLEAPVITSLDAADSALARIGAAEREKARIEADRDDSLERIRTVAAEAIKPLDEAIKRDTAAIHAFLVLKPEVLPRGKKSVELTHGTIGFRFSTKLVRLAKTTKQMVVENLLRMGKSGELALRVKREADLEALRGWKDDALAGIGMKRVEENNPFAEPKREKIDEAAA